jgi:hypothetical protein
MAALDSVLPLLNAGPLPVEVAFKRLPFSNSRKRGVELASEAERQSQEDGLGKSAGYTKPIRAQRIGQVIMGLGSRKPPRERYLPLELLGILDLVPDGARQAEGGLFPPDRELAVLQVESVEVLEAAGAAAARVLMKDRALPAGLLLLRGREADAPMVLEVRVVQALVQLLAYGHAPVFAASELLHRRLSSQVCLVRSIPVAG